MPAATPRRSDACQPVVHFEVVPSPVSQEVSEPANYGFLDLVTSEDGTGIRGGVGGGAGYASHTVFYVGVPVNAAR